MTSGYFSTPDFVILGVQADDGVYVYASKDLTKAELEAITERREIDPDGIWRRFESGRTTIILTATMREVILVKGDTYAEAFRSLFASWTPPEPERFTTSIVTASMSKHHKMLNRLEPHLGCVICRGPLQPDGVCRTCDAPSPAGGT
jgi:hypothetical protein